MDNRFTTRWLPGIALVLTSAVLAPIAGAQPAPQAPAGGAAPTTGPSDPRGEGRGRREGRGEGREQRGERGGEGRPEWRGREGGPGAGGPGGSGGPGPSPFPERPMPPVSDAEWSAVMESLEKVSPNRWKMVNKILDGPEKPFHAAMRAGIAKRFRELSLLEKTDPERYAIEVRRDGVEDEIFGLLEQYRAGKTDELKAQIRERVTQLVDARLDLRKLRVARVEKELASLRLEKAGEALKAEAAALTDPAGREKSINQSMEMFLNHARGGGGGPRRPRGEGQPPSGPPPGQGGDDPRPAVPPAAGPTSE